MENLNPELVSKPISEWQLNIVTILFVCQLLGRAFTGLSNGGGLVGVWNSIMFGSTTAKASKGASVSGLVTILIACFLVSGCAINRQYATTTSTNPTNGVVTISAVRSSVIAFGDVKNAVTQTKATAGKTLSAGAQGVNEETTSGAAATLGQLLGEAIKAAK